MIEYSISMIEEDLYKLDLANDLKLIKDERYPFIAVLSWVDGCNKNKLRGI